MRGGKRYARACGGFPAEKSIRAPIYKEDPDAPEGESTRATLGRLPGAQRRICGSAYPLSGGMPGARGEIQAPMRTFPALRQAPARAVRLPSSIKNKICVDRPGGKTRQSGRNPKGHFTTPFATRPSEGPKTASRPRRLGFFPGVLAAGRASARKPPPRFPLPTAPFRPPRSRRCTAP
jgi:hypothetical protein